MTSIEEGEKFLIHHGILGQKWGHRKDSGSVSVAGPSRKEVRQEKDRQIVAARIRQSKRAADLNSKAAATYLATTQKGRAAAQVAYDKAEHKALNNPDAKTAELMTHGEKVATGISIGVIGATSIAYLGIIAAASK